MAEFLDLIESVEAENASIHKLFGGDDKLGKGTSVRQASASRQRDPKYQALLAEAVKLTKDVFTGRKPIARLKEALSTSDFPLLFADTIDRMMLAQYRLHPSVYARFLKTSTVPDFRSVKRFKTSDGDQRLQQVPQGGSYPGGDIDEASYSFSVKKYGRRFDLLWEALMNDDLDALKDTPKRMARAAQRTEDHFAASLWVANATLFNATHAVSGTNYSNKLTGVLSLTNLKTGWNTMAGYPDEANSDMVTEPIFNQPVQLVIGRKLELAAKEIVGQIQYITANETNVLRGVLEVVVEPYIEIIDATNGGTSWYLFADKDSGHAAEVAKLRGYEEPQMFMKSPDAIRLGGGNADPIQGDFGTDNVAYKVRHVVGGSHANATGGWRFALWSDGTV